jgi:hypothetical protein
MHRIPRWCILVAFLYFAGLALGQVTPGNPSFVPQDCGQYDCVNLQNLNVSLNVPLYSKSGAFPLNLALSGGGSYFFNNNGTMASGILVNPLADSVNGVLGYYAILPEYTTQTSGVQCPTGDGSGTATKYTGWYLATADGTVHTLPSADAMYSGTNCFGGFTDQVTDGTGWTLNTTSSGGAGIYASNGITYSAATLADQQSSPNKITYTNGSGGNTVWTDTLGMVAVTRVGGGGGWTGQLEWTDTNGNTQTATVTRNTNATLKTSFGCSGITDEDLTGQVLPTKITFPDGTDLALGWEANGSAYTGRLSEITMRDGSSTVQFNYASGGFNCTYLIPGTLTRHTSDGTVTYNWAHLSGGGSQTTRLDIGKNETIYTFSASGLLTQVQSFHNAGTISAPSYGGTADLVTTYCYNSGKAPTVSSCPTATVTEPIAQLAVFTSPNGLSTSETYSTFDGYGNTTLSETWDYGSASTGIPLKETEITYGTVSGAGGSCSAVSSYIHNKPCMVRVLYQGSTVSLSDYAYSSAGNLLTSYISPNGGTSYLSNPTVNSYNSNGTPSTLYDLAGNSTAFTYSPSYYADCSSCTQYPFPTKRVSGGLTTYAYYNGYGGVKTEDVDANGNDTQYCYNNTTTTSCSGGTADPWNRVMAVIDPLNNEVFKTYSVTNLTSSFTFNGSNSIQGGAITFDGYGRVTNVQRPQSPSGSNYDTVSTYRTFPSGSQVNEQIQITNPCSVASATLCGTTYAPTNTYDMLGRMVSSVQSGSNATVTITYNENDVTSVLKPAPSGENTKGTEKQYNALGWLTSTCAISSVVSGETSCGQNTGSNSGILTTVGYSANTGALTVTDTRGPVLGGAEQHTVKTDGMGRMLQKKTPEGGTWTYTYDTNTSCPSGWRGVSGQLASVSDANGNLFCYSYDSLNRVTGVNADGTTCRWFYYDNGEGNGATSGGYTGTVPSGITLSNQYGRMVDAATDTCVAVASHTSSTLITDEWFAYDKDGHQATLWQLTPHSTQYYESTATFFGNGVPTTVDLANPSEYTMTYGIDGEGRFNTLTDTTAGQDIVTGTTYFPAANPEVVSLTGTDNNAYTYDLNTNQMTKFVFTVGSNNLTGNLHWNANNTLGYLTVTDGFNSGGSETCYSNASGSVGAGYDDLGRLVEFDCGSGNWGQQFSYDQFDNLTKTVLSGRTGTTWNPTYNASNQCPSPCTYDSDGNMTADGNEVYGWNAFSKLAWTATSGTPTCGTSGRCATYDAFGRMVETSNNSTWQTYWYTQAGGVVMMNGTTLSYAHWPTTHGIAELLDTTNFGYMPKDWIGNTRIISNVGSHTVSADQSYTPYGEIYNIFGANNSQYQVFAGTIANLAASTTTPIMWDTPNRELSYTGRFLSPDPAGFGWNQYAYPTNPNIFSDPSGLVWISQPGGGPYCMVTGPTSGAVFHANAVETRCQNGNQGGGDDGGDGEDPGDDSGFVGSDGWGDPFAGAGGPSISPLEGNPYDENVAAVYGATGPGLNISGSVGADSSDFTPQFSTRDTDDSTGLAPSLLYPGESAEISEPGIYDDFSGETNLTLLAQNWQLPPGASGAAQAARQMAQNAARNGQYGPKTTPAPTPKPPVITPEPPNPVPPEEDVPLPWYLYFLKILGNYNVDIPIFTVDPALVNGDRCRVDPNDCMS